MDLDVWLDECRPRRPPRRVPRRLWDRLEPAAEADGAGAEVALLVGLGHHVALQKLQSWGPCSGPSSTVALTRYRVEDGGSS